MRIKMNTILIILTLLFSGCVGLLLKHIFIEKNYELNTKLKEMQSRQQAVNNDLKIIQNFQQIQSKKLQVLNKALKQYDFALNKLTRDNNLLLHNIELIENENLVNKKSDEIFNKEFNQRLLAFQQTVGNLKLRQDGLWAEMQTNIENIMTISGNNDARLNNFIYKYGTKKMKRNFNSIELYQNQIFFSER